MECIYLPKYTENEYDFKVPNDESKHLKALRLNKNDKILVSNGKGIIFETEVSKISNNQYYLNFIDKKEFNRDFIIDLAIGNLKHRDRFEFAIEKSVELGINNIFPFNSQYTEKNKINIKRLEAKAISALKQSKNPYLSIINDILTLDKLNFADYETIILCDLDGSNFQNINIKSPALIIVGPEGGLSNNELQFLEKFSNLQKLFLSSNRLRTETAVVASVSLVSNLISKK